ncbi:sunset domain-containing protein [Brevibacillus brevis]|uniref:sunset domain-containing protein n=1 Tax=Brevibacillus brevis TaxID=1393 RepID=UPI003F5CC4AF
MWPTENRIQETSQDDQPFTRPTYHVLGGMSYEKTTANIELFCTEAEAQAAGYRKAKT